MQLTQEELAALIAQIYGSICAKHKARKDAGEEVSDDITTDEILAELAEAVGGDEEPKDTEPEVSPELITQVIEALKAAKGAEPNPETKSAEPAPAGEPSAEPAPAEEPKADPINPETKSAEPAPAKETKAMSQPQRKYADLFISRGAVQPAAMGFKARMEKMSAPERRKTAYGMFGRAVKCINASGGDVEKSAFIAERKFNDSEMAHEFKALAATVPSDGGYLVPEVYANEIIELLYPATVIYSLGARRLGMSNGNLNIPKIKTGTRAMFVGENRAIPKTAPKFGNLRLSAKKLTALIPMSNDLLRSTNFDNDVIVGQDVTKQMALGVDYGALLGTGGEFQPLGITKNKGVQNIDVTSLDAAYADNTGAITAAFPNFLVASVLKNNVYADGLGFVFNTSVEQYLKSIRDNVGGFIFAKEMNENGTLVGYPYKTTNLLETTNGKTSIIFGNWNDLVLGEQGALEIETSREGTWTDESGNLISAFENDQTLIRAINNVDAGLRHDESFAVATKVAVPV